MKIKLLFLFFLVISTSIFAQEYIFGKVTSESQTDLRDVMILNVRTDEKTLTDKDGNYMIAAKNFDELRFIKAGFDRFSAKISPQNYTEPLNISLQKSPFLIEEVEIGFQASGDLKKDIKKLEPSRKTIALNNTIKMYLTKPPAEVAPTLKTPSAFAQPDFNAGQVNIFGLVSAITGLVSKPVTKANYAETQEFFREIKTTVDLSFYYKQGWDEYEIDRFLIYADDNFSLAKKYRKNFKISAISSDMRMAYQNYVKTHKIGS